MPVRFSSRVATGTLLAMAWVNVVLIAYALLTAAGGVLGYVEKHSVPSIVSGFVIGALIVVSILVSRSNLRAGYVLAGIVTLLTLGFFLTRGIGKPVPTTMIVASLAVLGCLVAGHLMNRTA